MAWLKGTYSCWDNVYHTHVTSCWCYQLYSHRGFLYAFGATCAFAVPSVCVKVLQDKVGSNQLAFFRAIIILVTSFISLLHSGTSLRPRSWHELKFFTIHATFSTLAVATSFYAFQNMQATDAASIMYAYPGITGLLGKILFNEPFGFFEIVLLTLTMGGVLLVAQPSFIFGVNHEVEAGINSVKPLTPLVALAGCFCVALVVVSVRAMGKQDVSAVKVLFYYGLMGTILPGILATVMGQWNISNCVSTRLMTVFIGLTSFLANLLFVEALAIENAVYVSIICMNEALVVFVLEILFLGMKPQLLSVIGMVVILGSSIALTLMKSKQQSVPAAEQYDTNTEDVNDVVTME